MAFVPAGRCSLTLRHDDGLNRLHVLRVDEPLLFDMYEVTRRDWKRFVASREDLLPGYALERMAEWPAETDDWPAAFMTQHEARDFAATRGMRLPTAEEWVVVAMDGSRESPYPWGHIAQDSVANTLLLHLQPKRPTPVGTFEGGRTRHDCYDMLGNVWEWVEGRLPPPARSDSRVGAMGGSYLSGTNLASSPDPRYRPIYDGEQLFAQTLDPGGRGVDVGFRCCVVAERWLTDRADELGDGPEDLRRLRAVGQRWGPRATGVLETLNERAPSVALEALLEGSRGSAP